MLVEAGDANVPFVFGGSVADEEDSFSRSESLAPSTLLISGSASDMGARSPSPAPETSSVTSSSTRKKATGKRKLGSDTSAAAVAAAAAAAAAAVVAPAATSSPKTANSKKKAKTNAAAAAAAAPGSLSSDMYQLEGDEELPTDPALLKEALRKLKNKRSAQISRDKKKLYVEELEAKVAGLEEENARLRAEVSRLRGGGAFSSMGAAPRNAGLAAFGVLSMLLVSVALVGSSTNPSFLPATGVATNYLPAPEHQTRTLLTLSSSSSSSSSQVQSRGLVATTNPYQDQPPDIVVHDKTFVLCDKARSFVLDGVSPAASESDQKPIISLVVPASSVKGTITVPRAETSDHDDADTDEATSEVSKVVLFANRPAIEGPMGSKIHSRRFEPFTPGPPPQMVEIRCQVLNITAISSS